MSRTKEAFDVFRKAIGVPRELDPKMVADEDQVKAMISEDGLELWRDGSVTARTQPSSLPEINETKLATRRLWVVREDDVAHAEEEGSFGRSLKSQKIKHSNLTGGNAAYSGGELVVLDAETILLNGCSGRYGPRTKDAMDRVARAFADSGYNVWSMGFDQETNRPAVFGAIDPEWVA